MNNKKYYIVYQITNKINDKIYIGIHITNNVNDKYFGSGSNIKKAIKEFGKENFEKIILHNFETKEEMLEKERELVNNEFIKRNDTYNVILGGGQRLSINLVNVKDKDGNNFTVHKTDPRYLSGELVGCSKNTVTVKDENGNTLRVPINGPRYLSGELVSTTCGNVSVKDKNGNNLVVSKSDPRYLSGELIALWKNKKHSQETKRKMSIIRKGKNKGKNNSQYGTCWIFNDEIKENKKINKNDLNIWENKGWRRGRRIKNI